eukprot:1510119-Alexandrium_andersonii.AAC.1
MASTASASDNQKVLDVLVEMKQTMVTAEALQHNNARLTEDLHSTITTAVNQGRSLLALRHGRQCFRLRQPE